MSHPDTEQREPTTTAKPAWELTELIRPQSRERKRKTKEREPTELPHYPHVVAYVYMSRYATAAHIQRRFPAKFKSDRTLRYQLRQLVRLGYLKLADVTSTSPNFPHVYICTGKGLGFLRQKFKRELPNAREEASTLPSILHELFLTEFELGCWATIQPRDDLTIRFTERRYHLKDKTLTFPRHGKQQRLIPDAGFLLSVTRADQPPAHLLYFVEMDNGTERASVVLDKFRAYEAWAKSERGQQYLVDFYRRYGSEARNPNFRLLMITRHQGDAGDDHRLAELFTEALELSPAMRDRLWLTTVEATKAHAASEQPLAAPIWYRVRDAKSWQHDYQTFVDSLPSGRGQKPQLHQRRYVAEKLPELPRHAMFPRPVTNTIQAR